MELVSLVVAMFDGVLLPLALVCVRVGAAARLTGGLGSSTGALCFLESFTNGNSVEQLHVKMS